jgi:hypothetical protein
MGLLLRASGPLRLATLMLTLMLLMMLRLMLLPPLARLTPMMLPLATQLRFCHCVGRVVGGCEKVGCRVVVERLLTLKSLRLETLMLQVM